MTVRVAVTQERHADEPRVAATPETVKKLIAAGCAVVIESGAGKASSYPDADYEAAGATIAKTAAAALKDADVLFKVRAPSPDEIKALKPGAIVAAALNPYQDKATLQALAEAKITAFAMEFIPRITRAQVMDMLSSQANLAGYRAVIEAAEAYGRALPMMMTAAGTIAPAKVFVMGVGVAGLQAIATAKRLGAKVRAYDVRSAAKEEAESAGAVFVKLGVTADAAGGYARELTEEERQQQQAALLSEVANADVVITTAAVPGRKAPILVTTAMVDAMSEGSLVIDMAADGGGNCELTVAGEVVEHGGVRIVGLSNPPAQMGAHASFMYANNVLKLLALFGAKGELNPDWSDEVVVGVTVARNGQVNHGPTAEALGVERVAISVPKESE